MKKILCICLSSTIQRTITFNNLGLAKVNRSEHYRQDASGKAVNSARVLNQLEKGCVKVLCPLGEENRELFFKLIKRDNIDLSYVSIPGFTRECWTLLDKTAGTTTELVVSEPDLKELDKEEITLAEIRFFKYLNEILPQTDAVILAGSKPSYWTENLYPAISSTVKAHNKIFLADYTGSDLLNTIRDSVPDIIKINHEEFCKTFDFAYPLSDKELKDSICEKSRKLNNIIIITRGEKSTYAADKGVFYECPIEKITPVNTTACGDSFNSGFIYDYLQNGDFYSALEKGTWCASRNAQSEIPGSIYL